MIKIAIIDSGIDGSHFKLKKAKIRQCGIKKTNDKLEAIQETAIDKIGHGTACAGIIHKYAPNAEIISLRIFERSLSCSEELLLFSLEYCIDTGVNIINCSIGLEKKPSPLLFKVCKEAYDKNIIIVAACANDLNRETYPAFFPFIFGVTSGLMKSKEWGYIPDNQIKYIAKGTLQRVLGLNNTYNITGGTSYACPHLTSVIANLIYEHKTFLIDDIHNFLKEHARHNVFSLQLPENKNIIGKDVVLYKFPNDLYSYQRINWMRKIAVFPATDKEIESIIKFESLITPFELVYTIDYPRNIRRSEISANITNLSDIDYKAFDTIVIGYFYNQLFERNVQYGYELITNCLNNHIHIFSLSPDFHRHLLNIKEKNFSDSKSLIYTPEISEDDFRRSLAYNYLPENKCPVLTVIGTGSQQGKLSTQLRLRMILEKKGYKIAHIGTEPQSEILGANFCFPIGYSGNVSLNGEQRIKYLRNLVRIISHFEKPDIIISGTQGWTITRSVFSEADETSMANFLYGIQPDAVICAINPEDTIEFIEKNLQIVNLFTQSKCIFFVLTPYKRSFQNGTTIKSLLGDTEYKELLVHFSEKLRTPVFDIFDESNDKIILNLITDFFS